MADNNFEKHVFKKDRYSKARGGNSCFLNIFCSSCKSHVALYQKDGPGALIRMYLDRIFAPSNLADLQYKGGSKKNLPNLQCKNCHALIGNPMVYELENRLAFRLVPGAFIKKNSDGMYPPLKS
ncbi:MAG: hypothetical protein HYV53_01190 [Parcubacteria group bacterium]|nr:hypothetical protein [Parcubacteria group bacterium]